jgi:hypothetical protein
MKSPHDSAHCGVVVAANSAGAVFGFDTTLIPRITRCVAMHCAKYFHSLASVTGHCCAVGREAHRSKHSPVHCGGCDAGATCCESPACCSSSRRRADVVRKLFVRRASMSRASTSVHPRVLAPMYLARIAPGDRRGALIGFSQVDVAVGGGPRTAGNFCVTQLQRPVF